MNIPPDAQPAPVFTPRTSDRRASLVYGLIGVTAFSLTLPATRVAVAAFDPVFVGLGRAVGAAVLAGIVLIAARVPFPERSQLPGLALVAAGVIIGFPLSSAWAMRYVPA